MLYACLCYCFGSALGPEQLNERLMRYQCSGGPGGRSVRHGSGPALFDTADTVFICCYVSIT